MSSNEQIKPITYLKNRTSDLDREVAETGSPVVITQNGEGKVVVMDLKVYNRWKNAMALMKILSQSQADVDSNRLVSDAEAHARVEAIISSHEE